MAKTQKFDEDLLLTAVVKYADVFKGKIKATELAKWSRDNIDGLAEVKDYNFTRPIKERNEKNGKIKVRQKMCTVRINDINKARSITTTINTNILLSSSNYRAMFELPKHIQENLVVETRQTVDVLLAKNTNLQRENDVYRRINREQVAEIERMQQILKGISKKQKSLEKKVNYLIRCMDEEMRRKKLAEMGIADGVIDLNIYKKKIEEELEEAFNINKVLIKYVQQENKNAEEDNDSETLTEKVLKGIDF